ncbi:MAG: MbnH family di-heme enzyme, partial [Myxococcota bacterium]
MTKRFSTATTTVALGTLVAFGCGGDGPSGTPVELELPSHFPQPNVPEDNPLTEEKVELGRHLFYDRRLSANETQSCGDCHQQALAFTDGMATAVGSTGEVHPRATMGLTNVVYSATFTWANDLVRSLESQAAVPLFEEDPIVELGLGGREEEMLDRLRADEAYQEMFQGAFPRDDDPFTVQNVLAAIGSFERVLLSTDAPIDRFQQGDTSALSESAQRGLDLFFGEKFECFHCHGGFNFQDALDHQNNTTDQAAFHNTGLYNVDGRGAYPPDNQGLYEVSNEPSDMGHFKAPSLRNVELTAPYMHDGSVATLEEVLEIYAAGGRNITEGE